MVIFVDTSAIYALLNEDDPNHGPASDVLRRHIDSGRFVTHNYVVIEAMALIQRRLGMRSVRRFRNALSPLLEVSWIDHARHERAVDAWLRASRRNVSLVDQVSFDLMRERGIRAAFAFDRDFAREGFAVLE